jgi:hypothetical protein
MSERLYAFMKKREMVRLNKEAGHPWPWTDDKILQTYKFTNVKREHDRTTKWMREHWTGPNEDKELSLQLFNCALFRYFGTSEFAESIGWQHGWETYEQGKVKETAARKLVRKQRVFTGAYVITNQGVSAPKQEVVVDYFLTPFFKACPDLVAIAQSSKSWEAVATAMRSLQGFGGSGFMTKEVLQDAIHTPVLSDCTDQNTFCPVGPGARRGLNRLFDRELKFRLPDELFLKEMIWIFADRHKHWPKDFVELELHDIQFQLCEYDKYERVRLGQGRPRSRYRHVT